MGERVDRLELGLRAFSVGVYVIYYRALEDGVQIARVVHGARDVDAIFGR